MNRSARGITLMAKAMRVHMQHTSSSEITVIDDTTIARIQKSSLRQTGVGTCGARQRLPLRLTPKGCGRVRHAHPTASDRRWAERATLPLPTMWARASRSYRSTDRGRQKTKDWYLDFSVALLLKGTASSAAPSGCSSGGNCFGSSSCTL